MTAATSRIATEYHPSMSWVLTSAALYVLSGVTQVNRVVEPFFELILLARLLDSQTTARHYHVELHENEPPTAPLENPSRF